MIYTKKAQQLANTIYPLNHTKFRPYGPLVAVGQRVSLGRGVKLGQRVCVGLGPPGVTLGINEGVPLAVTGVPTDGIKDGVTEVTAGVALLPALGGGAKQAGRESTAPLGAMVSPSGA